MSTDDIYFIVTHSFEMTEEALQLGRVQTDKVQQKQAVQLKFRISFQFSDISPFGSICLVEFTDETGYQYHFLRANPQKADIKIFS